MLPGATQRRRNAFSMAGHCSAKGGEIRNPARDKPSSSVESHDHGFDVDDRWVIHCADRLPRRFLADSRPSDTE